MSSTFAKALVAALAYGTALALPQGNAPRADAPADNDALISELKTEPTVYKRLQRLLTDGKGELLNNEELTSATIYDFNTNQFPVGGSKGGVTSTVSTPTAACMRRSAKVVIVRPRELPHPCRIRNDHELRHRWPLRCPPPARSPSC
jgi:hypothetical protein